MTQSAKKDDGTYTTSAWLLEEKGAALALGKPIVLMIEEGVTDFGGLQGDWQRQHFGSKSFLTAALRAVEQLKLIYLGSAERQRAYSAGDERGAPAGSRSDHNPA